MPFPISTTGEFTLKCSDPSGAVIELRLDLEKAGATIASLDDRELAFVVKFGHFRLTENPLTGISSGSIRLESKLDNLLRITYELKQSRVVIFTTLLAIALWGPLLLATPEWRDRLPFFTLLWLGPIIGNFLLLPTKFEQLLKRCKI